MRIGKYQIRLWPMVWRLGLLLLITIAFIPNPDLELIENQKQIPIPTVQGTSDLADISFLIVQVDAQANQRRVLQCTDQNCTTITPPSSVNTEEALFDGSWWYHYADGALLRTNKDGNDQQVIKKQSELVTPRSAIISPDGSKVAYWLDNRTSKEGLTEIWVFNTLEGGSQVIAEKITREDVITRLRWNHTSSALWFLADNGVDEEKIETVVVNASPPSISARFTTLDADSLTQQFQNGSVDINDAGTSIAIAKTTGNITELITAHHPNPPTTQIVNGSVPYVAWQNDGTLVYASQAGSEIIFWRAQGSNHIPITSLRGVFRSAHSLPGNQSLAFIADTPNTATHTINLTNGNITQNPDIPTFGQYAYLVNTNVTNTITSNITTELSDGEITAFIQKELPIILEKPTAKPVRIIVTDQPNTVYIDYEHENIIERTLITIRDVIHTEWQIHSHYETIDGQWQRIGDSTRTEPSPLRLYEWEETLNQWIQKQKNIQ